MTRVYSLAFLLALSTTGAYASSIAAVCDGVPGTQVPAVPYIFLACGSTDNTAVAQAIAILGSFGPDLTVSARNLPGGTHNVSASISGDLVVTIDVVQPGTVGSGWSGSPGTLVPCVYTWGQPAAAGVTFGASTFSGNPSNAPFGGPTCEAGALPISYSFGTPLTIPFSMFATVSGPNGAEMAAAGAILNRLTLTDSAGKVIYGPPCVASGCPFLSVTVSVPGLAEPGIPIPEPSGAALAFLGTAGLAIWRRMQRGRAATATGRR